MAIDKLVKHQAGIPFVMNSRDVIQSIKNPEALAIWVYLQSLPENWVFRETQIRSHFSIGRTRYLSAMRELRESGLYQVKRRKNDAGQFIGSDYHIYALPHTTDSEDHSCRNPHIRKPTGVETDTDIKGEDITKIEDITKPEEKKKAQAPKPKNLAWKKLNYSSWPALPDDEQMEEIMQNRRKKGGRMTQRAMDLSGKELVAAKEAGHDIQDCFDVWEAGNWIAFNVEWYRNYRGLNGTKARQSRPSNFTGLDEVVHNEFDQTPRPGDAF